MTKVKYTPGPWWYSRNDDSILADPMGMLKLAKVHPISQTDDGSSNGKLMAAAPEMLEALIWAKEQFKRLADEGKYPEFMLSKNGGQGVQPIVNAIHKAIE